MTSIAGKATSELEPPEVVIVGGGPAGLAAAATASELGMRSIVIEKTSRLGGQLHVSAGRFSGAGTRLQSRRGIEDSPDRHFRDIMRLGHERADPNLLRLAVTVAPEAVDWLETLGFPFHPDSPGLVTYHETYSRPRTYWGETGDRPAGLAIHDLFLESGLLDDVEIRFDTRLTALRIEQSQDGPRIAGIEVEGLESKDVISARNVVLATGGYAADRDLVGSFHPDHPESITACLDHASGDAHKLLMDIDVPMTHADTYVPSMGLIADPERPGFAVSLPEAQVVVDAAERPPWEIWVNTNGERFVAEDEPAPARSEDALRDQPGQSMYVIWDESIAHKAPPLVTGSRVIGSPIADGDHSWLISASSLNDLAQRCGLPFEALQSSIADYNNDAPDSFGRQHRPLAIETPPFYAVRLVGGLLVSWAGPRVDRKLRPITKGGQPILGLYAVGELLGMGQLCGDTLAGGMGVGPAIALGRQVVQNIRSDLHAGQSDDRT